MSVTKGINKPSVKRQRQWVISCRSMVMVTLGNGSGTDFQASPCIPMEAATSVAADGWCGLALNLLSVIIAKITVII